MSSLKRSRKGVFTIVPEFLVKLIFAIAASLLVIFLLYAIWHMIFSSDEKAVMKSFQTFYSVIDSKSQSTKDYDSSYITLYTGEDHYVCLFSKNPSTWCAKRKKPADCTSSKACLCLFDGVDDDDVKKCLDIDGDLEIGAYQMYTIDISQYVNFQGMNVGGGNTQVKKNKFNSLIVAVQNTVENNNHKRTLYVWRENDINVALDRELSKPLCPNNDNICFKQKQDEILKGKIGIPIYDKILAECREQKKNTPLAKCSFSNNRCDLSCLDADIRCNEVIKKCDDYSRYSDDGTFSNYFIVSNSPAEWLCLNDGAACATANAGCQIKNKGFYICDKDIDSCTLQLNDYAVDCSAVIIGYSLEGKQLIIYNELATANLKNTAPWYSWNKNPNCKSVIDESFDETNILACKYSLNCNEFINEISKDKYKDCDFVFMETGGVQAVLLNYYSSKSECRLLVEQYFEPAKICTGVSIPNP